MHITTDVIRVTHFWVSLVGCEAVEAQLYTRISPKSHAIDEEPQTSIKHPRLLPFLAQPSLLLAYVCIFDGVW